MLWCHCQGAQNIGLSNHKLKSALMWSLCTFIPDRHTDEDHGNSATIRSVNASLDNNFHSSKFVELSIYLRPYCYVVILLPAVSDKWVFTNYDSWCVIGVLISKMGKKKDRKERKQTGSQKTALKTEKKTEKKAKKMLQERGEVWPFVFLNLNLKMTDLRSSKSFMMSLCSTCRNGS